VNSIGYNGKIHWGHWLENMKVGLSLNGGAARGLIHLGAIEELENSRVPIDMIGGCSIGAMIGAMYALTPNVEHVKRQLFAFLEETKDQVIPVELVGNDSGKERRSLLRKITHSLRLSIYYGISLAQVSLLSTEQLKENIAKVIPDADFTDCKIPFVCSATDITNNREYYFTKGSLLDAVTTSCSIPGLYPPVLHDGVQLVDGGWSALHLTEKLREMGAGFVIAVDIQQDIKEQKFTSGLDVVLRSNMAARNVLGNEQLKKADAVIQPDTCGVSWWDFSRAKECFVGGKEQTSKQVKEIKQKIRSARLKSFFK